MVRGAGNITVTVNTKTASKGTFTEYATVTTLAGDGTQNWKDATGTAAQFYTPNGLAIDNDGNLLVADRNNNRIRSITLPGAVVTTIAGDGSFDYKDATGTAAEFNDPYSIAVNKKTGAAYVTDRGDNHIRKINLSTHVVTTYAGSTYSGDGHDNGTNLSNIQFDQPQGIAIDAFDNIYVTDRWFSLVRELLPAGNLFAVGGNATSDYINGTGNSSAFYFPDGIALAPDGNSLYVADYGNSAIRKISIDGTVTVTTFAGKPQDMAQSSDGNTDGTGTAARFYKPSSIVVDADGNLYITDSGNDLIRQITTSGVVTTIAGSATTDSDNYKDGLGPFTKIYSPSGITIDSNGDLYISDGTNRIRKIVL